jgi:hypothetical protein
MIERDQHVDRLLRDAMQAPLRAETADCLDVETLAAWSEGSLDASERTRAEAHAATCTRCQSLLAAMIRTEPIVATPRPSPFRTWLLILGPAMGAAAAVALWFAVDRSPLLPAQPAATVARLESQAVSKDREELKGRLDRDAAAETKPSAPAAAPSAVDNFRTREADKVLGDDRIAGLRKKEAAKTLDDVAPADAKRPAEPPRSMTPPPEPAPQAPPPPPSTGRADRAQVAEAQPQLQNQSAAQNQMQNSTRNSGPSQMQNQAPAPASPSQNAGQVSQAAAASGERRANETAGAIAGARVIPESETVVTTTATQPKAAARGGATPAAAQDAARVQGFTGGRQEAAASFEVPTPNAQIRYRVVDGRTVQRTTDAGKTWTTVHVVLTSLLRIGSAPSPTVCWLAGTSGIIVTTSDGVTWRQAKAPEAADITAITATSTNAASVITANGRAFTTINGGQSWAGPK